MALSLALMGVMAETMNTGKVYREELTPDEIEELERVRAQKRLEIMKQRGVKEWTIEGITVYAMNLRNAKRKVANIQRQLQACL